MSKLRVIEGVDSSGKATQSRILFEKLKIRLVPHLTFHLDESLNRGFAIENILKEMHANGQFGEEVDG